MYNQSFCFPFAVQVWCHTDELYWPHELLTSSLARSSPNFIYQTTWGLINTNHSCSFSWYSEKSCIILDLLTFFFVSPLAPLISAESPKIPDCKYDCNVVSSSSYAPCCAVNWTCPSGHGLVALIVDYRSDFKVLFVVWGQSVTDIVDLMGYTWH